MSFGAGFATGVFKSLDIGLQKSREREKDFDLLDFRNITSKKGNITVDIILKKIVTYFYYK